MDNSLPTLTIFIYLELQGGNGSLEEDSLVGALGKSQIVDLTSAFHDIVVPLLSHIWLLVTPWSAVYQAPLSFLSILPMNIHSWFPLGLTVLTSLLSKGLPKVFPSTAIHKHQFLGAQPSLWSNFHICTWLPENHHFDYTDLCQLYMMSFQ